MGASVRPQPADDLDALIASRQAALKGTPAPAPHDDLDALIASRQAAIAPAPAAPRSSLYNAVNTVDNALTGGLGQKFNAAWNAVGDVVHGRDGFTHSFTKNLDAENEGLASFRQAHPYGAAALGAVGGAGQVIAAAPLAAAGEVASGLGLGARTAAAAKMGAGLGAAGALGNAGNRGSLGETVIAPAVKGAALGAAAGATAVPASQAILSGAQKVAGSLGSTLERIAPNAMSAPAATEIGPASAEIAGRAAGAPVVTPDKATSLLLQRMQRAGLTPQDALDRLAQIPADKPVSVMEVAGDQSHPLRQLGKWVARTPSAGAGQLRAAIADRMEPLPNAQRVLGDVSEAMGQPRTNLVDNATNLKAEQIAKAKPFYDAAFSGQTPPVPLTAQIDEESPTLADLMKRPSIKSALKFHNTNALERGEEPITLPTDKAEAAPSSDAIPPIPANMKGAFSPEQWADVVKRMNPADREALSAAATPAPEGAQAIPLKTLQTLKFHLDDAVGFAEAHDRFPDGSAATNQRMSAINDTRRALLDIMKAHSPEYAQGNALWAGDAAEQDASKGGMSFLSRPISELQSQYPKLTPGEQAQHNVSAVGGPIRDRVFNTMAVDRAKMFSNPDMQERLQSVIPPERFASLTKKLGYEHQIALTNQAVTGGSDTAENLANDADASGHMLKSMISGVAMGRPRRILSSAIRGVVTPAVDAWARGINEQTANALGPKLTAGMKSRPEAQAFLDELATQFDQMQRSRASLPHVGASAGSATGALVSRKR